MLRKTKGMGWVMALALAGWVAPAQAQLGAGRPGVAGPHAGGSPAIALEHQEELELDGDQVAQLEELQAALEADVLPLAEEMKSLREQIREGEVARDDGFRRMEALRGQLITAAAPLRGRVQEILTVAQHRRLQMLVRQGRPGFGRAGAMRGSPRVRGGGAMQRGMGFRGRPGQIRGFRGMRGMHRPFMGVGRRPGPGLPGGPVGELPGSGGL